MISRYALLVVLVNFAVVSMAQGQEPAPAAADAWQVGTPIVTYYAGPPMTEAVARQMAEGGFNVVWCGEKDLDLLGRHGLRGMLRADLLSPATLESPEQREKLDALLSRVAQHPSLYSYYIIDEPSSVTFPGLGKLLAYLREHDPKHMAYINLFPTYASNQQLGTQGDAATAYREYLRQFVEIVQPQLVSYDHYQFFEPSALPQSQGDSQQYFLNLRMIRQTSQDAGIPFLNIVQASSWAPGYVRVPAANEMRYLVYTTLAYGAEGISYYVYSAPAHQGGMRNEDGTPTPIYNAVKPLNREFVAIATELQPLRSLGIYHTALKEAGCEPLPADAPFRPDSPSAKNSDRGLMLGLFGPGEVASHVLVVNLDYRAETIATIVGSAKLEKFDAVHGKWSSADGTRAKLPLLPGGGQLLRVAAPPSD